MSKYTAQRERPSKSRPGWAVGGSLAQSEQGGPGTTGTGRSKIEISPQSENHCPWNRRDTELRRTIRGWADALVKGTA